MMNIGSLLKKMALVLVLSMAFIACEGQKEQIDKANIQKTVINVEGMTCEGCEATIQGNVAKMSGVVSVKASHVDKNTIVEYDKTQTSVDEIEKIISETGYRIFKEEEKKALKEIPTEMKCGAGKCGAGKCGSSN